MPRRTIAANGPDPIDLHVGRRMRLRRILMGFSQSALADAIGLTFQQVQKYERGANRISASVLYRSARKLEVPVTFFYDDMDGAEPPAAGDDTLCTRETMEMARAFADIEDDACRKRLADLARAMARQRSEVRGQRTGIRMMRRKSVRQSDVGGISR